MQGQEDEMTESYGLGLAGMFERSDEAREMRGNYQALLRVARAVQARRMLDMTYDEIGESNKEIEEALGEVGHLLEVDDDD